MSKYYCGYKKSPKFIRKILSYKFNESCKIHDENYSKKSELTRYEADDKFLKDCKKQANGNKFWIIMAYLYYFSVKLLGKIAFKSKN